MKSTPATERVQYFGGKIIMVILNLALLLESRCLLTTTKCHEYWYAYLVLVTQRSAQIPKDFWMPNSNAAIHSYGQ